MAIKLCMDQPCAYYVCNMAKTWSRGTTFSFHVTCLPILQRWSDVGPKKSCNTEKSKNIFRKYTAVEDYRVVKVVKVVNQMTVVQHKPTGSTQKEWMKISESGKQVHQTMQAVYAHLAISDPRTTTAKHTDLRPHTVQQDKRLPVQDLVNRTIRVVGKPMHVCLVSRNTGNKSHEASKAQRMSMYVAETFLRFVSRWKEAVWRFCVTSSSVGERRWNDSWRVYVF